MSRPESLLALAGVFAYLSLVAVGGGVSVLPEMQRQVVDIHGWMSTPQFAELFTLAQAAPGPNILVVTLIGWKVAGFMGALVATLAMCLPSCMLSYGMGHVWQRFYHARWRLAVQLGLAPITVGLVTASGYLIAHAADHSWMAFVITAATLLVVFFTRINPLWMLALGAVLGWAGVV